MRLLWCLHQRVVLWTQNNFHKITYVFTCILTSLLTYLLTYLHTYIITYFLFYILTYILTFLLIYFLTYLLTYLLIQLFTYSMQHSSSWETNRFSASQDIPPFYGTRMFITAFTRPRHISPSWSTLIQSLLSHPTSWKSIIIFSSLLGLVFPSGLFSSKNPTENLYTLIHYTIRSIQTSHCILLYVISRKL